jgi:hypothetical protein
MSASTKIQGWLTFFFVKCKVQRSLSALACYEDGTCYSDRVVVYSGVDAVVDIYCLDIPGTQTNRGDCHVVFVVAL